MFSTHYFIENPTSKKAVILFPLIQYTYPYIDCKDYSIHLYILPHIVEEVSCLLRQERLILTRTTLLLLLIFLESVPL